MNSNSTQVLFWTRTEMLFIVSHRNVAQIFSVSFNSVNTQCVRVLQTAFKGKETNDSCSLLSFKVDVLAKAKRQFMKL